MHELVFANAKFELCIASNYMTLNIVTLKSELEVIESHWKWHHSIDRIQVPICIP